MENVSSLQTPSGRHTVLFIVGNRLSPRLRTLLRQMGELPFVNAGIENHMLMGLRQCTYFQPDVIFLDNDLLSVALDEYLNMLSGACKGFRVLLYRETTGGSVPDDPRILAVLGSAELTADYLKAVLGSVARAVPVPEPAPAPDKAADLFAWLENGSGSWDRSVTEVLHTGLTHPLWVIMLVPIQSVSERLDRRELTDRLRRLFRGRSNLCFSLRDTGRLCLIADSEKPREEVLKLLEELYGDTAAFYHTAVRASDHARLPTAYRQARELIRHAYFEAESRRLDTLPPGAELQFDLSKALDDLFFAIVRGERKQISAHVDTIYWVYIRGTGSFDVLIGMRRRLRLLYDLVSDLCTVPPAPFPTEFPPYLTKEAVFMEDFLTTLSEGVSPHFRATNKYVLSALCYIQQNITGNTRLSDVASFLNLSPPYISTLFKNELNINLKDYLAFLRDRTACRLLQETDLPVNRIALQVGIDDPRYFSRRFRARWGMTPSEYRKAARDESENADHVESRI